MRLERLRTDLRHLRGADFVRAYAHKALKKIVHFDILEARHLEPAAFNPLYAEPPEGVVCRPLTRDEIVSSASLPEIGWSDDFVAQVLRKDDVCYGAFVGGKLVSYGWYSTLPTAINEQLTVRFDGRDVYAYKGYTLRAHRGERLTRFRIGATLQHFVERGHRGFVCYVSATNYASLYSTAQVGYRTFGRIYVATFRGRPVVHVTRRCLQRRFTVEASRP